MKKTIYLVVLYFIGIYSSNLNAQKLAPYIKVGDVTESMLATKEKVEQALQAGNFEILGVYSPENNSNLTVIAFTRSDLKNTAIKVKDRGAMAAVLKVGLVKKGATITVSYTNPMYIFNAYLRKETPNYTNSLNQINEDVKVAFVNIGNDFAGFGGEIVAEKLWKYHYKMMMPYFSDPVKLNTYASFEEGVKIIEANLSNGKGNTKQVYKLLFKDKKVAVYGVALLDIEDGEPKFLPKIGEDNVAAMPYEIILQGNTATMLHGKYRLAVSWPELSMGTFMKIMSTPGNIKDMLKGITQK